MIKMYCHPSPSRPSVLQLLPLPTDSTHTYRPPQLGPDCAVCVFQSRLLPRRKRHRPTSHSPVTPTLCHDAERASVLHHAVSAEPTDQLHLAGPPWLPQVVDRLRRSTVYEQFQLSDQRRFCCGVPPNESRRTGSLVFFVCSPLHHSTQHLIATVVSPTHRSQQQQQQQHHTGRRSS